MYAFRFIEVRLNDGQDSVPLMETQTLVELTRAQAARIAGHDSMSEGVHVYDRVHTTTAHAWVQDGGHHETRLWIDEGRVRKS